jgi:hypothetical protein
MTSPKPARNAESHTTSLIWAQGTNVQQVLADEAILQYAADRVYLSVGQVQMPPAAAFDNVESVTVETVARLVFTAASFHKLLAVLNHVADQIPRPETPKGEGQR